jgi:tripartite-type tricarboxylate transporter receptor subunit TctC
MEHRSHGGPRRRTALAALAATAATWPAVAVHAQAAPYPNKAIRIVVPFAAGGTVDSIARDTVNELAKSLGQGVYFDNKPGANGILGTDIVAHSPADGYTLLLVTGSFTVNPYLYRKLPYDVRKDFVPITSLARALGLLLVVNPSVPANNVQELVALSHKPGVDLNYSSPGAGNTLHLCMEYFKQRTGARITHVPYKGTPQALNAVIANEVQMQFTTAVLAMPFVKTGKLKALAFSGPERVPGIEVPTMAEAGVKDMVYEGSWVGLFGPAGMPQQAQDRLAAEVARIEKRPEIIASIAASGSHVADGRPQAEFKRQIQDDLKRFADLVKMAGVEPE